MSILDETVGPISIHTLHTEGDVVGVFFKPVPKTISIHSLHTEGDGV